jgi:hypothetical protein
MNQSIYTFLVVLGWKAILKSNISRSSSNRSSCSRRKGSHDGKFVEFLLLVPIVFGNKSLLALVRWRSHSFCKSISSNQSMQACQTRITQEIKRLGNAHGPLTQPLKTNHHKTNQAKPQINQCSKQIVQWEPKFLTPTYLPTHLSLLTRSICKMNA